jgi:hypothetical protein
MEARETEEEEEEEEEDPPNSENTYVKNGMMLERNDEKVEEK